MTTPIDRRPDPDALLVNAAWVRRLARGILGDPRAAGERGVQDWATWRPGVAEVEVRRGETAEVGIRTRR